MREIHVQLQPDLVPDLVEADTVARLEQIGRATGAEVRTTAGFDEGRYVNLDFAPLDAAALWNAIRMELESVPALARIAIVCCHGEHGWDDYSLLHHYDPAESLDPFPP